jgi:hypothetical protein
MVTAKVIIIGSMAIVAFLTVFSVSHQKTSQKDLLHREIGINSILFSVSFLFLLAILIKLTF